MNYFIVVVIASILNAGMDAIDHMKRSRGVFDLWHILKAVFLLTLIAPYFLCHGVRYFLGGMAVVMFSWFVIFECCYGMFKILRLDKLDDKIHIPLLGKLLGYEKWRT